jgi:APA family basic amino acid/polyamine antiporter
MIGTGVFTTSGLLLAEMRAPGAVLLAWLLGGLLALCGALAYAELAASIARNGGEYRMLSDTYHPAVGFVAGWICLVVGFSAPIAASSMAFGKYLHALVPGVPPLIAGIVLVLLLSIVHALRVAGGALLQNVLTLVTVLLILAFIVGTAWLLRNAQTPHLELPSYDVLLSPTFAAGVVFVSFAYSGWNAAAYLSGEVRNPSRTLPLALGLGTGLVTLLYLGLNAAFLLGTPARQLTGTIEVGHVAAVSIFGASAGYAISAMIAVALVSSVSALIMVGPRVYEAAGQDYTALRFLRLRSDDGGPLLSIGLQALLAVVMLVTFSFDGLLMYIGITLSASAALTVAAVFVRRRSTSGATRPYSMWGYPVTPALFISFAIWLVVRSVAHRPLTALLAFITIAVGLIVYVAVKHSGSSVNPNKAERTSP